MSHDQFAELYKLAEETRSQIGGFIHYLKKSAAR